MLNSPLKPEDGQIYLSMKEYVVFVRFILEMNFIFFLCANILKSLIGHVVCFLRKKADKIGL
jgi:hypothetical protein